MQKIRVVSESREDPFDYIIELPDVNDVLENEELESSYRKIEAVQERFNKARLEVLSRLGR